MENFYSNTFIENFILSVLNTSKSQKLITEAVVCSAVIYTVSITSTKSESRLTLPDEIRGQKSTLRAHNTDPEVTNRTESLSHSCRKSNCDRI